MQQITPRISDDYFTEITKKIGAAGAGDRISLTTMGFDPAEPQVGALIQALIAAAQRSAHVLLVIDAIAFTNDANGWPSGPVFSGKPLAEGRPLFRHKYDVLQQLEAAGVRTAIINMPPKAFRLPYAGRSHLKITAINADVYVGGCNLSGSTSLDMMLRMRHKMTAEYLHTMIAGIADAGSTAAFFDGTDQTLPLDANTTIYIDAGKARQSVIMQQALAIIDAAEEHIVMTCQFFPDATVVKHLEAARARGVRIDLYYNHPSKQEQPPRPLHYLLLAKAKLLHGALTEDGLPRAHRHLHMKLLASEKTAMLGSHNYVDAGVVLGTAEIALLRHDPSFARELISLVEPHVQ